MIKNKVGMVTEEEKSEIKGYYERKLALSELFLSLKNPTLDEEEKDTLYDRIVNDMSIVKSQYDKWWSEKSTKYQWSTIENGTWSIDFESNEIFVISNI